MFNDTYIFFRNKGLSLLVGPDWRDFFDVVIVQARKPRFFTDESRPLRVYDIEKRVHLWDRITKLEKGKIYYEVSYIKFFPVSILDFIKIPFYIFIKT